MEGGRGEGLTQFQGSAPPVWSGLPSSPYPSPLSHPSLLSVLPKQLLILPGVLEGERAGWTLLLQVRSRGERASFALPLPGSLYVCPSLCLSPFPSAWFPVSKLDLGSRSPWRHISVHRTI